MKKIYLLALLATCFSLSLFANGIEIDGIYYLLDDVNYTASVTYTGSSAYNNNSYAGEVIIPATIDYNNHAYSVISIGDKALYSCKSLISVTIPNSVTSIENDAFYNCSSLTSITIPNSITSIGTRAFRNCESLTSLAIPNSVTSIGNYAFWDCSGLTSVTIPNSVTRIGDSTFDNCSGLTSVTIPNSVTNIGNAAFQKCSSLTSITIPSSVTSIESYAFYGCSSLTSVTIPNSVTSIGGLVFQGCTGLTSITIPNSVTRIGNYTFSDCTSLTSITIPNSVTSIENWAFRNCTGLTFIEIPNSVTSIGYGAFSGCTSLTSVYCEAITPPELDSYVFDNIPNTAILYVPSESTDAYKAIAGYADSFAEIRGMYSHIEDITANTATLKWLPDTAVVQYDINVYTSDTLFAHYVVDSSGHIVPSQHSAPAIYKQKLDTTVSSTDYFVITLSGLSAGTAYTYTIDGINAQRAPIYHEEGSFTTLHEGEEGFFDAIADDPRRQTIKILRDGQLYILRNGKTYDLLGR